jgi:hypothetical protein
MRMGSNDSTSHYPTLVEEGKRTHHSALDGSGDLKNGGAHWSWCCCRPLTRGKQRRAGGDGHQLPGPEVAGRHLPEGLAGGHGGQRREQVVGVVIEPADG